MEQQVSSNLELVLLIIYLITFYEKHIDENHFLTNKVLILNGLVWFSRKALSKYKIDHLCVVKSQLGQ